MVRGRRPRLPLRASLGGLGASLWLPGREPHLGSFALRRAYYGAHSDAISLLRLAFVSRRGRRFGRPRLFVSNRKYKYP